MTVRFDHVTVRYPGQSAPALQDVDLHIAEGELVVVVGPTGCGKSTLLRSINGLVPHFSGGDLHGVVTVDGRSTATHPPRALADLVGFVPQNPADSFVCERVEDEVAYVLENLGVAPVVMRRRVEEALDLLSIEPLRDRMVQTLSGGQQQRVAIAAVLSASPRVLVLDEPTSALDPAAAEEVLAAVTRLVHDVGLTVVMAEHRLERVLPFADRIVLVDDTRVVAGDPAALMERVPFAPPVVELGRRLGWSPLPLTVRDARRQAQGLRDRLPDEPPVPDPAARPNPLSAAGPVALSVSTAQGPSTRPPSAVQVAGVSVRFDTTTALRDVTLAVAPGERVAVMGRNGSGKSSLLGLIGGVREPDGGTAQVDGRSPFALTGPDRVRRVGVVPQDPNVLLYSETVDEECALADQDAQLPPGTAAALLRDLAPTIDHSSHPRALSEGQRLLVALAIVLVAQPQVVVLDEPTRGLDYPSKSHLSALLGELAASGTAVVFATHDVEFAAVTAGRVVVLANGEVIADGPAREVVCHSRVFAPQIAKVMEPKSWLTVDEVVAGAVDGDPA